MDVQSDKKVVSVFVRFRAFNDGTMKYHRNVLVQVNFDHFAKKAAVILNKERISIIL
jgi:hypothetical protein